MGATDYAKFAAPISEDDPCGPDLDALGDDDHLNFLARVEGVLPPVFSEFDRASIDFNFETKAAADLLGRSRDLRVLVVLAKLLILDRQLGDFAAVVEVMAELLEQQWATVHPMAEGGDVELRRGILMALDDMPHAVMPLQSVPLFESRNLGSVSYRNHLVASGATPPRDTESVFEPSAVNAALERAELDELQAGHAELVRLERGLARMTASFATHLGAGRDLAIPKLRKLAGEQAAWLGAELRRRDPARELDGAPPVAAAEETTIGPPGIVTDHAQATAALDAIAHYLARQEPSSVGLLLVRQCRQLAGMSFLEAFRTLVPDSVQAASIRVGQASGFNIPIERLAAFETVDVSGGDIDEASGGETEPGFAQEMADGTAEETADRTADDAETAPVETGDTDVATPPVAAAPAVIRLKSRGQANDLMAQVAQFYRAMEPSSPLPLLLDRARGLAGRDFLTILEEMLPASHLRASTEE
ncbi:MAG: ImpA family type VI secretion system protein [Phreatobacter sp.]